jgi:hypothetical protein
MKIVRQDRTSIAWVLCASLLFSLLACGIHHGQMGALSLSGLSDGFCSVSNAPGPYVDVSESEDFAPNLATQMVCPLCSSFAVVLAVNTLSWGLDYATRGLSGPIPVYQLAQPPPRYVWPALNPRASPIASIAVTAPA